MNSAMSNEYDYLSGWEERLGEPGTTIPSEPTLVKGDPVAVWLVCAVGVIILGVIFGLVAWPEGWAA